MPKKTNNHLSEYKKKYQAVRHHAWAGFVLLAVLLAVRIFLETAGITIDDRLVIGIGAILVVYTVIAVLLTYKYRSGLSAAEEIVHVHHSDESEKEKIRADVKKERLKLEKKKAKAEEKARKKEAKAKAKKEKKKDS